ncbi:hypothetical protein [Glutamicibacter sp. NPDC087673]|uniref:hypothetical protein n=1 Tax=Glutamicibacter sp. NPDC087673 TaxID=3363997 RepID=UPI003817F8A4
MFRNAVSFIAISAAVPLCLSGCSSGQLSTKQSCALINELAVEHSIEEKRALAYMGILAQNSQPAIEAMETAIGIYREVSEQTGDRHLRTALRSEIENYQDFIDLIANRSFDDPTLASDVEAAEGGLQDQYTDYVRETCPASASEPDPSAS